MKKKQLLIITEKTIKAKIMIVTNTKYKKNLSFSWN